MKNKLVLDLYTN